MINREEIKVGDKNFSLKGKRHNGIFDIKEVTEITPNGFFAMYNSGKTENCGGFFIFDNYDLITKPNKNMNFKYYTEDKETQEFLIKKTVSMFPDIETELNYGQTFGIAVFRQGKTQKLYVSEFHKDSVIGDDTRVKDREFHRISQIDTVPTIDEFLKRLEETKKQLEPPKLVVNDCMFIKTETGVNVTYGNEKYHFSKESIGNIKLKFAVKSFKLDDFDVIIEPGVLHVGCRRFNFEQVHEILNWFYK
jgi:hypothetical protein